MRFNINILRAVTVGLLLMTVCGALPVLAAENSRGTQVIFIGHARGPRNFEIHHLLPDFVRDLRHLRPDAVIVAGDIISGYKTAYSEPDLHREWDMVDEYLNRIDAPVYRVVGNHDWHSDETAKVFRNRYGREYYSETAGNVQIVGLNSIPVFSGHDLDWGEIWSSDSPLPNEPSELPDDQLAFLEAEMNRISASDDIDHLIIALGAALWKLDNTTHQWSKTVVPLLKKSGKTITVLSGEIDRNNYAVRTADGIRYIAGGIGIMEPDQPVSLSQGSYLDMLFPDDGSDPDIAVRTIAMNPDNYRSLIDVQLKDADKHLLFRKRIQDGITVTRLNAYRVKVRDWLVQNWNIFDRQQNLMLIAAVAGFAGAILLLVAGIFLGIRRR